MGSFELHITNFFFFIYQGFESLYSVVVELVGAITLTL